MAITKLMNMTFPSDGVAMEILSSDLGAETMALNHLNSIFASCESCSTADSLLYDEIQRG
jgi:hypothetical protein